MNVKNQFVIKIVSTFYCWFFEINSKLLLDKTAEDFAKGNSECLDVLRGIVRQSKLFSGTEKKAQVIPSPSLSNEITLSDDTRSSRADKFVKIFAGRSVASNIQEHNDDNDKLSASATVCINISILLFLSILLRFCLLNKAKSTIRFDLSSLE
jgi:hypothetical protein